MTPKSKTTKRAEALDRNDECLPGCLLGAPHDGDCFDEGDLAEERLRSRDYEAWAAL